mmetsp:Transcript_10624/g.17400  ORF Transcript_10624/g.17400 Transcript_10624/m.17400 type:complete len:446 (-) Transcript_10624:60-1397(-)
MTLLPMLAKPTYPYQHQPWPLPLLLLLPMYHPTCLPLYNMGGRQPSSTTHFPLTPTLNMAHTTFMTQQQQQPNYPCHHICLHTHPYLPQHLSHQLRPSLIFHHTRIMKFLSTTRHIPSLPQLLPTLIFPLPPTVHHHTPIMKLLATTSHIQWFPQTLHIPVLVNLSKMQRTVMKFLIMTSHIHSMSKVLNIIPMDLPSNMYPTAMKFLTMTSHIQWCPQLLHIPIPLPYNMQPTATCTTRHILSLPPLNIAITIIINKTTLPPYKTQPTTCPFRPTQSSPQQPPHTHIAFQDSPLLCTELSSLQSTSLQLLTNPTTCHFHRPKDSPFLSTELCSLHPISMHPLTNSTTCHLHMLKDIPLLNIHPTSLHPLTHPKTCHRHRPKDSILLISLQPLTNHSSQINTYPLLLLLLHTNMTLLLPISLPHHVPSQDDNKYSLLRTTPTNQQ